MKLPEAALFRVLSWLETRLDQEITLADAADVACYSTYHFNRLFRRFTGEDFGAYVQRLRLENGAFLLRTGKRVTEAAYSSGYWTHEAFTRAFRRSFGRPPKVYGQEDLPENASDKYLTQVRKISWPGVSGYRRRIIGPYNSVALPGEPDSPWPSWAIRRFGISWDEPNITPGDKIRYDAFWTGTPSEDAHPGEIPGGTYLSAVHEGAFENLTESYCYLLYFAPKLWGLSVHPKHPPFEEFLEKGFRIYIPLQVV